MALPLPQPEMSSGPQAVRAMLLPEDLDEFDRQYHEELVKAGQTYDLTSLLELLERWRRWGMSSKDPEAHRRLLKKMARIEAGEPIQTVSWEDVKRDLGLE